MKNNNRLAAELIEDGRCGYEEPNYKRVFKRALGRKGSICCCFLSCILYTVSRAGILLPMSV